MMNTRLLMLGLAIGILSATAFGDNDDKTRMLFAKQCASCHSVPDPAIRTDMAWLDQVNRTS